MQANPAAGNGNRVKQVAGSSTFAYSYQGLNILYEKNVTGGNRNGHETLLCRRAPGGQDDRVDDVLPAPDALGSTRLVATASVIIKFSSNYVSYGSNYGISGKEVFMYTGKPYDSATGLYYEGARYYDTTIGRFITQDSIAGTQNDPMSLNRYVHARDNPMKIVDLAGHEWWNPGTWVSSASSALASAASAATGVASAVSNAWNSLPPTDRALIVVGVAVVATVATVGIAAPALGVAIGGEVALDASVSVGVESAATDVGVGATALGETAATGSSFSLAGAAAKSIAGGGINTAATIVTDFATGKSVTSDQIVTSFATGAIGGSLSYGFEAAGLSGSFSQAANIGGGAVSTLLNSAITGESLIGTGRSEVISSLQGTVGGAIETSQIPSGVGQVVDFGFNVLGHFFE